MYVYPSISIQIMMETKKEKGKYSQSKRTDECEYVTIYMFLVFSIPVVTEYIAVGCGRCIQELSSL